MNTIIGDLIGLFLPPLTIIVVGAVGCLFWRDEGVKPAGDPNS